MDVFLADYVAMNKQLVKLVDISADVENKLNDLEETVMDLDIFWDGEANAAFMLNVKLDFFKMQVLLKSINKSAACLMLAIGKYQQTEAKVEEIIGGMQ